MVWRLTDNGPGFQYLSQQSCPSILKNFIASIVYHLFSLKTEDQELVVAPSPLPECAFGLIAFFLLLSKTQDLFKSKIRP